MALGGHLKIAIRFCKLLICSIFCTRASRLKRTALSGYAYVSSQGTVELIMNQPSRILATSPGGKILKKFEKLIWNNIPGVLESV